MNTATIEVKPDEANEWLARFRVLKKEQRTKEQQMIARAYRWARKGHALLSLRKTMQNCGWDVQGRPLLAIARADARYCYYERAYNADGEHRMHHEPIGWRAKCHGFPGEFFPTRAGLGFPRHHTFKALAPLIPPEHTPRFALSGYQLLWEAEWEPEPPVDPLLLKHLGGDIYAVVAEWDLTEVERAVLAGRLR